MKYKKLAVAFGLSLAAMAYILLKPEPVKYYGVQLMPQNFTRDSSNEIQKGTIGGIESGLDEKLKNGEESLSHEPNFHGSFSDYLYKREVYNFNEVEFSSAALLLSNYFFDKFCWGEYSEYSNSNYSDRQEYQKSRCNEQIKTHEIDENDTNKLLDFINFKLFDAGYDLIRLPKQEHNGFVYLLQRLCESKSSTNQLINFMESLISAFSGYYRDGVTSIGNEGLRLKDYYLSAMPMAQEKMETYKRKTKFKLENLHSEICSVSRGNPEIAKDIKSEFTWLFGELRLPSCID